MIYLFRWNFGRGSFVKFCFWFREFIGRLCYCLIGGVRGLGCGWCWIWIFWYKLCDWVMRGGRIKVRSIVNIG